MDQEAWSPILEIRRKSTVLVFVYCILWGGLTAILPFLISYRSQSFAVATSLLGVLMIVLGYKVYHGSIKAAWGLVTLALFDIATRVYQHASGYLMPAILLLSALSVISPWSLANRKPQ